jgi:hypothetical protein
VRRRGALDDTLEEPIGERDEAVAAARAPSSEEVLAARLDDHRPAEDAGLGAEGIAASTEADAERSRLELLDRDLVALGAREIDIERPGEVVPSLQPAEDGAAAVLESDGRRAAVVREAENALPV